MSHELFGWDLLYKTVERDVVQKADVLIALAHWFLVRNATFSCLGVGEDKTLNENETGSELLPEGWNDSQDRYALRYVFNNDLYLLLGAKTEDTLIINLLSVKDKNVSNIALNADALVQSLQGRGTSLLSDTSAIVDRFKRELLDPVFSGNKTESTTQTVPATTSETTTTPSFPDYPRNRLPGAFPIRNDLRDPIRNDLRDPIRDVGRGDLDPFGRGGGMLYQPGPYGPENPLHGGPGQFPFPGRHGGPPGSRFDPFGPPDRNIRPNPNNDIFRPPYDDNMYM